MNLVFEDEVLKINEASIDVVDVIDKVKSISNKKKKSIVAIKIDNQIYDLNDKITTSGLISFIYNSEYEAFKLINKKITVYIQKVLEELDSNIKILKSSVGKEGFNLEVDMNGKTINSTLLKEIEENVKSKIQNDKLTFYFSLISASGVYSDDDKQIQKIEGIAFFAQKELDKHLKMLREREEKDHNHIGRVLDYFYTSPIVGQGLPLLTPKGTVLKKLLIRWIEDLEESKGYLLTDTPLMAKSDLYSISGHWEHYKDDMFIVNMSNEIGALRPMTCPFQFLLYKRKKRSYKELPIKYSETSTLFRNEKSGEMHGLIRVRQFTLSDGHIICRKEQLYKEFDETLKIVNYVVTSLGLKNTWFRLSKWDPNKKEKYIDNPNGWEESQKILKECLDRNNIEYVEADGEAAFYGPKADLQIRNIHGKEDTIITIQIDFALPERYDMTYVNEKNEEERPYIIHRSSIGCYERTIAFLLEQYEGKLPFWMSPVQISILPIHEGINSYANIIYHKLKENGFRVSINDKKERINKKVLEARNEKIPLMIILGDKEEESNTVSIKLLNNKTKNDISIDNLIDFLKQLNKEKIIDINLDLV